MILLTIPAFVIIAFQGVLFVRAVEGVHAVLSSLERWSIGAVVGSALSAYCLFLFALLGLPLTFIGLCVSHLVVLVLGAGLLLWRCGSLSWETVQPPRLVKHDWIPTYVPSWLFVLGVFLLCVVLVKIVAVCSLLLFMPAYFDDVVSNWNMRAKAFYYAGNLLLHLPRDDQFFFGGRVPSYPLTVYFTKLWMVVVSARWSEAAAHVPHLYWFLALIGMLFGALRRVASVLWSWIGCIALCGIPLVLVHASHGYADLLFATGVLSVVICVYSCLASSDTSSQKTWLFLSALCMACLLFIKSEATMLYLPFYCAAVCLSLLLLHRQGLPRSTCMQWLCIVLLFLVLVLAPWTLFKMWHGLDFGNSRSLFSLTFGAHTLVIHAYMQAMLYTGSFLLFFPCAFLAFLVTVRSWWRTSAVYVPFLFLVCVLCAQFALFFFFEQLSWEAVRHTGLSRALLQLVPALLFLVLLVMQRALRRT